MHALAETAVAHRASHFATLRCVLDRQSGRDGLAAELGALARRLPKARRKQRLNLGKFARAAIAKRLLPVLADTATVKAPESVTQFHQFRIGVKKLKYAIEPFMSIFPAHLTEAYEQLAVLQELVGLVHDDDVLLELIEQADAEGPLPGEPTAALEHLRARRQHRRAGAVALIEQMEADSFAHKLTEALH